MNDNYEDIINLPHHVSTKHKPMSMLNRAAQFSPFAALTGYESAIEETARLTDRRIELDETQKTELDEKLRMAAGEIAITYFRPDEHKSGGRYVISRGIIKKLDPYERKIILTTGEEIFIDDIHDIS